VESKKYQKVFSKRSRIAGAHVHLGTACHHPEATKKIYIAMFHVMGRKKHAFLQVQT
jgi:hypothetical protein